LLIAEGRMNEESQQSAVPADQSPKGQTRDKIGALDELFRSTLAYRRSTAYLDLMKFIGRFPKYAPYNCFLLHTQNPTVSYVATTGQWRIRFGRTVKPEAHPLVILAPMGPVAFVYDLVDTEGEKLPRELEQPFETSGHVPESVWVRTKLNCEQRDRIAVLTRQFSLFQAGAAMTNNSRSVLVRPQNLPAKRVVHLNGEHTRGQHYATLVHELAHIHCGHVGGDPEGWWPDRRGLGASRIEFEAESVAYLVCSRLRLETNAERYLAWYAGKNETIPDISLEIVLKMAGYIESLGQKELGPRKPRAKNSTA
jgi:hypothetical protein